MTFFKFVTNPLARKIALVAGALALTACASDVDDTTGSRLEQAPPGSQPEPPIEAGDIAIAGQEFSHSIRQLPQVSDATRPPLVQFTGVTSIVNGPVDTAPYTSLLRDRLLLGDREKLRFVERQLPPLVTPHKKGHGKAASSDDNGGESPDFQVLAELRGKIDADFYRIQIEFVDFHSGQVLFNGTYRIRKESPDGSGGNESQMSSEYAQPAPAQATPPPPTAPPAQYDGSAINPQGPAADEPPVVFHDH